jgi:hypothetical protein
MEQEPIWTRSLKSAKAHFQIADHMAYVTFTLLRDYRLIIKILGEAAESASSAINAFLQKAYSERKIKIYQDPDANLRIFLERIAPEFLDKKDIENVAKIMEIRNKHISAPVEFVRKERFIILLGDKYESLSIEFVKELMGSIRKLLNRAIITIK